jgi:hypothetical protein
MVLRRTNLLRCDQHLNDAVIFAQRLEGRSQRPDSSASTRGFHFRCHRHSRLGDLWSHLGLPPTLFATAAVNP